MDTLASAAGWVKWAAAELAVAKSRSSWGFFQCLYSILFLSSPTNFAFVAAGHSRHPPSTLFEQVASWVWSLFPNPNKQPLKLSLLTGCQKLNRQKVTLSKVLRVDWVFNGGGSLSLRRYLPFNRHYINLNPKEWLIRISAVAEWRGWSGGRGQWVFSDLQIPVCKWILLCWVDWILLSDPDRLLGTINPEPSAGPFWGMSITPRNLFYLL